MFTLYFNYRFQMSRYRNVLYSGAVALTFKVVRTTATRLIGEFGPITIAVKRGTHDVIAGTLKVPKNWWSLPQADFTVAPRSLSAVVMPVTTPEEFEEILGKIKAVNIFIENLASVLQNKPIESFAQVLDSVEPLSRLYQVHKLLIPWNVEALNSVIAGFDQ